ncbi:MAG: hypothetical protein ACRCY2_04620 [Bombilactobacillus sp.]
MHHSSIASKSPLSFADVPTRFLNIFLYASIVLPTGTMLGINFKILTLLLFIVGLALSKDSAVLSKMIISMTPVAMFLVAELGLSFTVFNYDSSYSLVQAKDIFVFFLMFYVCTVYAEKRCGFEYLIKIITKAVFIVGLIKLLIIMYSTLRGVPVSVVIKQISLFFNVDIMSFDVENSAISRINFTSDSIIAISVFYMIMRMFRDKFTKKDIVFLFVILFSALITMSRFQWASCAIAIVSAVVININKKKSFLILFFMVSSALLSLSTNSVQEMISTRFDDRLITSSDEVRDLQKTRIYDVIDKSPIIGSGMGYYIPDFIRSSTAKYSYELQLQALVMQIGFLGISITMLMIFTPLLLACRGMGLITFMCFTTMVIIWISGALFNPILFSSSAGAAMAALYSIAKMPWMRRR